VVALSYVFPLQAQALEDMVTAQRDAAVGRAQRAFARAKRSAAQWVPRSSPERKLTASPRRSPVPFQWVPDVDQQHHPATVVAGRWWGCAPWFLTSASQFRPAPPPAFGSAAYLAALAEIRHISDARTAEQIQIATFWAMNAAAVNPGEPTPPGFWMQVATDGINQHGLSEREATHLYALLGATMFDAANRLLDGSSHTGSSGRGRRTPRSRSSPPSGNPTTPPIPRRTAPSPRRPRKC